MTGRRRTIAIALAATLSFVQAAPGLAYENNQPGLTLGGGAHRKINQIAGQVFAKQILKGKHAEQFRRYDFEPTFPAGKYLVNALNDDVAEEAIEKLFKPAGVTTLARMNWRDAAYDAAQTTMSWKFAKWLIEGGFTADEPERFMSLRHFYNPVTSLGPTYLTDIPAGTGWAMMGSNPEIDAVTWATSNPDNQYNWTRGKEYLAAAMRASTPADAQRNYAAAWRSLGETMHLVADMSVPAHVRNDSHPGDWRGAAILDDLRSDAYEYLTNYAGQIERGWTSRQADPALLSAVGTAKTPEDVMTTIAKSVNEHFFSSDTIPYETTITTEDGTPFTYTTANNIGVSGGILYSSPTLESTTLDPTTGYYTGTDSTGAPVLMLHRSWLNDNGWDTNPGDVNLAVVQSQAQRLVPVAVMGAERLMEMFIPLVDMKVTAVETDEDTKIPVVRAEIGVRPALEGTGYAEKPSDTLMQDTQQSVLLLVRLTYKEGKPDELMYLAPPTQVTRGRFEISLENCTTMGGLHEIVFPEKGTGAAEGGESDITKIEYAVGLDLGGILIRSDYFSDEGIAGTWDVETSFDEVVIPPELLNTVGMSEEEAALYVQSIKAAYGGTMVGQTFTSVAEIVPNGANYTLKPTYDEKTAAAMAAGGYTMDLAAKLTGNTMRAESGTNFGVGSVSNVITAEVSADRKSMDGTFETKMVVQAGGGTITVGYKGTWKATKRD
jgi:hypothetical protein